MSFLKSMELLSGNELVLDQYVGVKNTSIIAFLYKMFPCRKGFKELTRDHVFS